MRTIGRSLDRIWFVVLTWNAVDLTRRAVRSILDNTDADVVLVDNGSRSDDAATLAKEFPELHAIRLNRNHGFARGVNLGARYAIERGARAIVLFNNDAYVPRDSPVVAKLADALDATPEAGAAGPLIANDGAAETIQNAGLWLSLFFPVPFHIGRGVPLGRAAALKQPTYLMGSCLMIRASLFAELGGLDPDYFLYGDDIDFAFRMRAHGFREILVRDAYVFHEKSMATREYSANYIYTALRSHLIMLSKLTRWYHRPTASVTMIAMSVALAILNRRSGQRGGATAALRAWRDFFGRRWGGFDGLWPAPEANSDSREFPTPSPQPALHAP